MKTNAKKAPVGDSENPKEDWYPSDIISALNKAGYTMAKLAEEHGLKSGGNTFSKALRRSYPIAEQQIADALKRHPMEIWPSRYESDGTRKLQGFHNLESTRRTRNLQAKQAGRPL